MAVSDVRQRFREVLENLENGQGPCIITQHGRAKAVLIPFPDYDALVGKAAGADQLRAALRWSLGFIVNITIGLRLDQDPQSYRALLRTAIEEGIRRGSVPRGVLNQPQDIATILREWDYKTFRTEQEAEVEAGNRDSVTFRHRSCSSVLKTMRDNAPFFTRLFSVGRYQEVIGQLALDFLCLPCTVCRSALVDWLSAGRFEVTELFRDAGEPRKALCRYVVRKRGD